MRRHATDVQEPVHEAVPSPPLPTDHVLSSGAVLFPGAYDQHGYPLVVFPVDGQTKLSTQLSKAEVVDFISYFHWLHIKKQEKQGLVSVVADLRQASPPTIRFIAETLLLLELHKRTVHSVYIVQPMKKDAVKLIHKVFSPAKAYTTSFKKVLLKEIPELSNYIDRSQLPSSLGGYLMYCHQSWVVFIKDIEAFVREFQSVVQRLPSCISTLQAITQTPLPSTFTELQHFCSTNEAQFLQLRRELGLDELLRHCESILDKLRYPDKESCYQAMAGTTLFTHTALDMLHNHSRITAAVQKVELLWQQAFSKAHLQLQVLHLREKAMQITENIETFLQQKLQPYKMEIARDAAKAGVLASDFEASMYNPAMALVCCAEDVTHTMAELFPFDRHTKEVWVLNLERLKDKMHSTVDFILQTLKAVTNYHQIYFKTSTWYSLILHENFLQELLSGLHCDAAHAQPQSGAIPAWRWRCSSFLRRNPPPYMEELLHLARVSELIPDDELKAAAKQMSQRCMTLRKLLISSGPVVVGHLQLALQWQYELLMDTHAGRSVIDIQTKASGSSLSKVEGIEEESHPIRHSPMNAGPELASAEVKPPSVSSRQDAYSGREGGKGLDSLRPALNQHQVQEQIISVSDSEHHGEECDLGSVGNSSRASLQIRPEVKPDSVNLEIKVKRTAALPTNPWLSLPVDDLENSYTITIRQNPMQLREESQWHDLPEPQAAVSQFNRSRDTQTEVLSCTEHPENYGWMLHSQSDVEEAEQSPFSKILSSTITDGREQSMCSMEEMPTLLWDSYDLHEQDSDAVDGTTDISLEDWDVKEQAGLREVEKMLITTNEILEEEENVLAQEAVLDGLLNSEDMQHMWPPWNNEDQAIVRPSSELAEAAVPGIDDCIDPGEADGPSDCGAKALDKNHLGAENAAMVETEDMHAFKTEEDKSMVETKLKIPEKPEVSCPADLSRHQPSVHSPPDQEFDPGGRDKLVHEPHKRSTASNAVRILHSESPVGQYQENGNTREMTHFKTPIVLDTGSGLMKAGFADQDLPSVLLPTIIGLPKYEEMINGHYERELYLGHNAQHMRGVLTLKHPIQNGIIRNWDEMEKIWQHTFQQLCVDPEDHPVLLTEAAMNSMENRQRMVQVMFESFNVPLTYVAMQAVLALYAAGRTTGVVFDSGDGVSYSVPVFEGYSLPHAVQRFPMAGVDVTMHLKKLLQEQGVSMRTTAEQEIVREMKEKCCYVALDYQEELKGGTSSSRETHYTMPDGQIVTLGTERFRAPEILFKPELIGRDHYGLHVGIFKSILGSDIDLRRCFLGNLVLSGGNTLLPGLPERLQAEIRSLLPADMASAVKVSSPTNRDFSVWCGGAVLASLSGFSSAWISQEEYEEYGPQIVFRKCF
ncbi:uncharacterized protein LOC114457963 isoform X5 [Gouania willdenowi]|uniref:uncharacterized protein LOC114457963 isoform X5 n=1 Tax=Gouania willdenowi TaxID=441366 RepID=UPI0010556124|nr:uncharacterized protein LOC114457963 isoform X5 [Gouania willdenowi]